MYEQFGKSIFDFGRKSAETALKANAIAAKTFSEAFEVQVDAAEAQAKAATQFWQQAGEVRDLESAQKAWTQGSELARDNLEKTVEANQHVMELGLNRGQELSDLFQGNFEAAKTQAKKATAKATK